MPRFRTCMSPTPAAVSASTGTRRAIRSDSATAWCVVSAPIAIWSPSLADAVQAGDPRTGRSACSGAASRSFISGISECPPASSLAPSPWRSSRPTASASARRAVRTRTAAGITPHPLARSPARPSRAGAACRGRGRRAASQTAPTIAARGRDRPRLADALDAQRVGRRGRHRAVRLDGGHVGRARAPGSRPACRSSAARPRRRPPLVQRLADRVDDAAVHLAVHDHRVDDVAAVVNRDVAGDLDLAGVRSTSASQPWRRTGT